MKPFSPPRLLGQRSRSELAQVEGSQVRIEVVIDAGVDVVVVGAITCRLVVQTSGQATKEGSNPSAARGPLQHALQRTRAFVVVAEVETQHEVVVVRAAV